MKCWVMHRGVSGLQEYNRRNGHKTLPLFRIEEHFNEEIMVPHPMNRIIILLCIFLSNCMLTLLSARNMRKRRLAQRP